jgi:biopolymer transport protein ExbD
VNLPRTTHHLKKQDTGEQLVVSVRKDGTYIDADRVDDQSLAVRIQQELKSAARPVFVRADRSLRYGDVRKVIEQVHTAGANTVEMQTEEFSKE